ncbi:MAG: hypothetical protein QOD33_651 [Pyrinomonadaceae bacterium]|nr:hypothetical protein [Pyrinomonadaceae bacterium]
MLYMARLTTLAPNETRLSRIFGLAKAESSQGTMKLTTKSLILFTLVVSLAIASAALGQDRRSTASASSRARIVAAVRAVLAAQSDAWNRGDLEGYMDGYARSADTVFVSGDTVTRGWQTVLDRYRKRYDSRAKMGTLTFSDLEITVLNNDAALVLGRWHLQRASDEPHGRFTLIFRRTRPGWRIVHDHSSAAD